MITFSSISFQHKIFVRVDGVNFSRKTEELQLEKPYDKRLIEALIEASKLVFEILNPKLAYIFSDEINFLFFPPLPYNGRFEKLNSIIPSIVSTKVSLIFKKELFFDSKIFCVNDDEIIQYLKERQDEAWRNHINSYAFYKLIEEGYSRREAAEILKGKKYKDIHEFLFKKGINLAKTPTWQRRGVLVYKLRKEMSKKINDRVVKYYRNEIIVDWEIPLFSSEEGKRLLEKILYS